MATEQSTIRSLAQNGRWANVHVMPVNEGMQNNTTENLTPLVKQLPPRGAPNVFSRAAVTAHPMMQNGFPFHVAHSANILFLLVNARLNYRLFPTVMPNVAGVCERCGNQVALETLIDYLAATAYDGVTVRDRGVRSRAFIVGFEVALFIFKSAGLSQPSSCAGPGVHQ